MFTGYLKVLDKQTDTIINCFKTYNIWSSGDIFYNELI